MASVKLLRASDGSGNAEMATVQATRAPLSSTIDVDTVTGIDPDGFIGTMGAPHTFTDPVTSEEITVVSEATAVDFAGHVDGGNLEIDTIAPGYTDNGSAIGDIVIIRPTTQYANNLAEAMAASHNDDGSLKTAAVRTALDLTDFSSNGWEVLGATLSAASGYNKGNNEFELSSDTDLTGIVSPGMRLRLQRGTAAPTQCTDLESSSTQYAKKTSPSGIVFTDDFTIEAWVKLESVTGTMTILSRYNGSTGFILQINANTGVVALIGIGTAGAQDSVSSTTTIPLGVWTHVAASLDMSGTSGVIYFNGVAQPSTYTNGAVTALIQAGDLQIGAQNGTSQPFDGKLADVRLWNAVRTATQIRDNMNQLLAGSETNLVAYYKLNGDFNDSTSNANHMTGQNSAVATSTDNPFSTTEYGIITKVAAGAITVFGGREHHIPKMTLSSPYYSPMKAPFGFNASPRKWTVDLLQHRETTLGVQNSPVDNTWYNMGSLSFQLPIGEWQLCHFLPIFTNKNGTVAQAWASLSTANNSESDHGNTNYADMVAATSTGQQLKRAFYHRNDVAVTVDTTMYLIAMTGNSQSILKWASGDVPLRVWAVCGWL